jgi:hypothetical protein
MAPRPANPIYASAMVRYLNAKIQANLSRELTGQWTDGQNLDLTGLLKEFQRFWAIHSENHKENRPYLEPGPSLSLSAFIQRAVNDGGRIIHEYAAGRGDTNMVVKYAGRLYPIGLKTRENRKNSAKSLERFLRYLDGVPSAEGWLIAFGRESTKSPKERLTWETQTRPTGQTVHIVGR